MVLVPIARELARIAVRSASRYYKLEGKAFNKLYTGFPRSSVIGRGVRHGLTTGSIAGTFITKDSDDSPGNAIQKPYQRPEITSRQPYQTRNRQSRRYSSRKYSQCRPSRYNRYSNYSSR